MEKVAGAILNNGHTIQVKAAPGGTLRRGDKPYELVPVPFPCPERTSGRRPSLPDGGPFVHKHAERVHSVCWGVSLCQGAANATFGQLGGDFPAKDRRAGPHSLRVDRAVCWPTSLKYWALKGSHHTPCSGDRRLDDRRRTVEWTRADIDRFIALYSMNARPASVGKSPLYPSY